MSDPFLQNNYIQLDSFHTNSHSSIMKSSSGRLERSSECGAFKSFCYHSSMQMDSLCLVMSDTVAVEGAESGDLCEGLR